MLILSDKWITTKCQPPDLRAWVADRAAVISEVTLYIGGDTLC